MYRVTDGPSWPFPHPGVVQLLDGGQQTASESLTSAENMLDLIPGTRGGRLAYINLDGLSVGVDLKWTKKHQGLPFEENQPLFYLKRISFSNAKMEILLSTSTETKSHNGLNIT